MRSALTLVPSSSPASQRNVSVMRRLFLAIVLYSICLPSMADWAEFSIAYRCDVKEGYLSIVPLVKTSGEFSLRAPKGYKNLPKGSRKTLRCNFKGHKIEMLYSTFGPQASGMCRGIGYSDITSLTADSVRILGPEEMNSGCFWDKKQTLISVKVFTDATTLKTERCTVNDVDWDNGFIGKECEVRNVHR